MQVQPEAADVDEPSGHHDLLPTFRHAAILSRIARVFTGRELPGVFNGSRIARITHGTRITLLHSRDADRTDLQLMTGRA
jgi:hypothetical protein